MNGLINPLTELNSFNQLLQGVKNKKTPILATGVLDSQKAHLTYAILQKMNTNAVIITHSELKAREIYEDMQFFLKDSVKYFPSKDIIFYSADVRSIEISKKRFETIYSILNGDKPTIVLSIEALFDRLSPIDVFKTFILTFQLGDKLKVDDLLRKLIFMGYERTDMVEGVGQFAMRGGILDIYTAEKAIRMEFWDDEIDSIRIIDVSNQRSVEKLENITIYPIRELVYDQNTLEAAIEKIDVDLKNTLEDYNKKGLYEEATNMNEEITELFEALKNGLHYTKIEKYNIYFYKDNITLLDYLNKDALVFFDEPTRIAQHSENVLYEFNESIKNRILKGYLLPQQMNMVFSYSEIIRSANIFPKVLFTTMAHTIKDFTIKDIVHFDVKSTHIIKNKITELADELKYLLSQKTRILILVGGRTKGERITNELNELELSCRYLDDLEEVDLPRDTVIVSKGSLTRGFEYQHIGFVVITDKEIFGEEKKKRYRKAKTGKKIDSFLDLQQGDYIVHDAHGIGIYNGIEKIKTDNIVRDYLKISYADGGSLFVPISQMDAVQKYIGGENVTPKLNRLSGDSWGKAKAKTRAAVKILAKDLVDLYAKRQAQKGYAFSEDTVWQKEFEEMFPYQETDDQLVSIEEVKKDMEDIKVMDRLLCGDVGYGKTEVAIRAAFKAVQDGKQVAYLVPTTILAQQHYNTFTQRMKDFPIGIEMLSRFRSSKQQKESMARLASGLSDIVIGTHRILSKDIKFRDLGLVVIDEEQRFGVSHKEKLKHLKANVDVLTLTATPIPRTLHMSMTGIRDMSVLEEPPEERQPVQTFVMENDPSFVRDAICRELARNGQVYYLHNRVVSIEDVTKKLQDLVPEAVIAYAHGQMSERELENILKDFIDGEIDVLVCTTIIETGIDISNVNTIIIQDADKMGLSQLYQLRGRVGRSNKIAYAYLLYKKDKVLQEIAEKRLQAIREFTEFGSGFKIAMRDLEIRGAGNLLGAEQHGHMDTIGYDLYCRLLEEAINELKGEVKQASFQTSVDIKIDAYIPNFYIEDEEQKLEIYKKISVIQNEGDFFRLQEELEDRFGDIPMSVQNLLDVALMKAEAHNYGIESIIQKNRSVIFTFNRDKDISCFAIADLIKNNPNKIYFTSQPVPYLTYQFSSNETSVSPKSLMGYLKCL